MPRRRLHKGVSLVLFVTVVVAMGLLVGGLSAPGAWYEELRKPVFNPPGWVFGPVWAVLYVLIAISGWRTFSRVPRSRVMGVWAAQLALNWAWTPVFFVAHQVWAAFAVLVLMLVLILNFIAGTWRQDKVASVLFLPYAAWVGFAGLLNLSIAVLN
ncbi:MAG: tryptophan-rich sensory protein [Roseibium sp.]